VVHRRRTDHRGRPARRGHRARRRESSTPAAHVIPGLIDAHDHLDSHGYGLATRFGLEEPACTATSHRARAAETLDDGYTTVQRRGGLEAGSSWP